VFPEAAQALIGSRLEDDALADAAASTSARLEPGEDLHASAAYRRHLAQVLVARALREARDRAGAQGAGRAQP
jgi:CO/xanthine dehydrogenase FAD-binding subunit